jgi:hypothetical protein
MLEWFFTYFGQLVAGILAFFAFWKDAKDYGELSQRWGKVVIRGVGGGVFFLMLASLYLTHLGRVNAVKDAAKAEATNTANQQRISGLSDQLKTSSEQRTIAENGFRQSFAELNQKFADLQTKVKTQELVAELDKTRKELHEAEAKFVQPKAKLIPSLWFVGKSPSELPMSTKYIKMVNGSVTVDFFAYNDSDTTAIDGSIITRICNGCKFASEPPLSKIISGIELDREFHFDHIYANSALERHTMDVIPPAGKPEFRIKINATCQNCEPSTFQEFKIIVE